MAYWCCVPAPFLAALAFNTANDNKKESVR
jgi:hypothetical protein